ncbi:hypothetical protein EDD95_5008 [Streptomyces sp. CEV 2-1]|nr:hypothetical protein EDD95_5008 [Streptomyces sp. CEV 2-1]
MGFQEGALGEYPTGIRISDDEIAALPITRHRFHGDWIHPPPPASDGRGDHRQHTGRGPGGPTDSPHAAFTQDPELTGMPRRQLSELIDALTPAMGVQREQILRTRRGHERLVAPGAGAKAKLTSADRVLAAVLHLRKLATMDLLGQLFYTTAMTISRAAKDVRRPDHHRPPPRRARRRAARWREARAIDLACVAPGTRAQAKDDNAHAADRVAS